MARRQDNKYQEQEQEAMAQNAAYQSEQDIANLQAQVSALQSQQVQGAAMMAPPAASPSTAGSDVMSQLQQLAQMKQAGVLSDQEFQAAKAKLLAG
ncbi:MAG: SHOCT domain-containing protein [Thermomicrobiales bacterium]